VDIDISRRLKDAVKRKHPEKRRTNSLFLLHSNAPAHRSVLVKDFLAKNKATILERPPYSTDLAPANFYVPSTDIGIKGTFFLCDAIDIIKKSDGRAEKAFIKWLPGMFPIPVAGRSVHLHTLAILKKM
jgi:hypothetical protein